MRPIELAGDDVTQFPPTKHAILELKKLGWYPDIVVFLEADVPFKRGKDVDNAIEALINSDADSIRSVCESPTPPQWMFTINKKGLVEPFIKDLDMEDPNICMRQNLPKVYHMTSVVDVTWTHTIMNTNSLFGKKIKAIRNLLI
jgi:CMP-N-acetylneuraminic acid synthetase